MLQVRRLPPQHVLGPRSQPGHGKDLVALEDDGVVPGRHVLLPIQLLLDEHEVAARDAGKPDLDRRVGDLQKLDIFVGRDCR
jgi:hypothetical protein